MVLDEISEIDSRVYTLCPREYVQRLPLDAQNHVYYKVYTYYAFSYTCIHVKMFGASLVAQTVRNLSAIREIQV